MKRKLASIQIIESLEEIPNADRIEVATVLGWHLVVKKGQFEVGDKCVYFETDSLLPIKKEFEFLAKDGTKKIIGDDNKEYEGYRLKTIKLRKQISSGLALSLNELKVKGSEGDDLTKELGIIKYEALSIGTNVSSKRPVVFPKWIPKGIGVFIKRHFPKTARKLWGKSLRSFPSYIEKTDEIRIQGSPKILERHKDKKFYVTEKLDGSSVTIFREKDKTQVCSRKVWLPREDGNQFWDAVTKIEDKLNDLEDIALQGELVGVGIQKNPLKMKDRKIYFFNAYDYQKGEYLNFKEFQGLITRLGLETVPIIETSYRLPETIDEMVEYSTRKSTIAKEEWAEGLVFRSLEETQDQRIGRLSFKCINPSFLLAHGD